MSIEHQSNINQTPIQRQSSSKRVSIRFQCSVNPFHSDDNSLPSKANPMSIQHQSVPIQQQTSANPFPIWYQSIPICSQFNVNPMPIQCWPASNLFPIQYQSNPNRSQSTVNQVPILSQSVPIQCKSNENQSSFNPSQSDACLVPFWCKCIPIQCQSTPISMPIQCKFSKNPWPIKCQLNSSWCRSSFNPVPILCQSILITANAVQIRWQSRANPSQTGSIPVSVRCQCQHNTKRPIKRQSSANPVPRCQFQDNLPISGQSANSVPICQSQTILPIACQSANPRHILPSIDNPPKSNI